MNGCSLKSYVAPVAVSHPDFASPVSASMILIRHLATFNGAHCIMKMSASCQKRTLLTSVCIGLRGAGQAHKGNAVMSGDEHFREGVIEEVMRFA